MPDGGSVKRQDIKPQEVPTPNRDERMFCAYDR